MAQFKIIISQIIQLKNKLHPTDYNFENTERQILE